MQYKAKSTTLTEEIQGASVSDKRTEAPKGLCVANAVLHYRRRSNDQATFPAVEKREGTQTPVSEAFFPVSTR